MPASNPDPIGNSTFSNLPPEQAPETDSMSRTSGRRALWSALAVLAIVTVLFVAFYDISAYREQTQTTANRPATPVPPQTTGQGGSRNEGAR